MSIPEKILQAGCDAYCATFLNGLGSLGDGIEAAYLAIHEHADWVRAGPPAWTGEGLPPAGTVCEFQFLEETRHQFKAELLHGHKVTVIAHYAGVTGRMVAAFTFDYEDGNARDVESATEAHFRPVRTPEQIAADKRAADIEAMRADIGWKVPYLGPCPVALLYDAGYRKQPTP